MEWKELSWNLFTILCQGSIGGLIVVFVTEWLRCRREKEALRNYATLVWMEIFGHKIGFDFIAARQQLPYDQPHPLKTSDWEQTKFDLAIISPDDFKQLTAYYQSVDQLDALFTSYHGADWNLFAEPFRQTHYTCNRALEILDKYRTKKPNMLLSFFRRFLSTPFRPPAKNADSKK